MRLCAATGGLKCADVARARVCAANGRYAQLKAPPLAAVSLLILPETPANGGMWYAQNTERPPGKSSQVKSRTWSRA